MTKTDFHIHTIYCDGKNSPFEMAEAAYKKGVKALGFSAHSYIDYNELYWTMSPENAEKYKADVLKIKEEYEGKMDVLLGVEEDIFSRFCYGEYEYAIGSAHMIKKGGKLLPIDHRVETTRKIIDEVYNGKFDLLAKDYYTHVMEIPNVMKADIIGHIDVITKFVDVLKIELSDDYYEYAFNAIEKLSKLKIPFEINTGGVSRGHRLSPYPDLRLLKKIKEMDCDVIYSSDSHDKNNILFGFQEALILAKSVGFTRICRLTKNGYAYDSLD